MSSVVLTSGPAAGKEFQIESRVVIGRQPDGNGLALNDPLASRHHAEIVCDGERWVLRDLGSRNGTFLEGNAVRESALSDGAKIRIGQSEMVFRNPPPAAAARRGLMLTVAGDADAPKAETEIEIEAAGASRVAPDQLSDVATAQRLYRQLQVILDASQALSGRRSLSDVLNEIMGRLLDVFPGADRSFIILADAETGQLHPAAARTRDGSAAEDLVMSRTIIRKVMTEKRAILSRDDADSALMDAQSIQAAQIRSFMCAPLLYRDRPLGILQVDSQHADTPFTEDDLRLLSGLTVEAALAIQNSREERQRQLLYLSNIGTLVRAVEARDPYTRGHSLRVAEYSVLLARRLNLRRGPDAQISLDRIRYAGQLHDAGKINIGQEILHKPGKLTDEEFVIMKQHPAVTHFLLSEMHLPPELKGLDVLGALHHERYDGKGYPCGFKGAEVPIEARIMAVADTFDAMTSDRPYRKRMETEAAMAEIARAAGTQLDPEVAAAFAELYKAGALTPVLGNLTVGEMAGMPTGENFRKLMTTLKAGMGT